MSTHQNYEYGGINWASKVLQHSIVLLEKSLAYDLAIRLTILPIDKTSSRKADERTCPMKEYAH